MKTYELIAFDLDGTLTQHKSPLSPEHTAVLRALSEKYRLLMVGAGSCRRIYDQMNQFPIDIVGNYGMQRSEIVDGEFRLVEDHTVPQGDKASIEARAAALRERFGLTEYAGDSMEYHASGMLTFPLLGTKARLPEKLACDPDRSRRKKMYPIVAETFSDYTAFIGGSSSFDLVPRPFGKLYALDTYCRLMDIGHDRVLYVGDDYGEGGNDEPVYRSDIDFLPVDDYREFPRLIAPLL